MLFNNGGVCYSGTPGSVAVFGGFVNPSASAPAANTIIQAAFYVPSTNTSTGATGGIGKTLSPIGTRVPVVLNPTTVYAPQVASGGSSTIFMLDLRGYPADIVSVHMMFTPAPGTSGALPAAANSANAQVLMIDNVNNFIYGVVSTNAGAQQAVLNGAGISFAVFFKDSFVP